MKFKITKHDMMMSIIYIMFGWIFFQGFFIDLGFPTAIRYVLDLFNGVLFFMAIAWGKFQKKINLYLGVIYSLILILGFFSFLIYNQSISNIILYILDSRNLIRFVIFFTSCTMVCCEKDVRNIFKFILFFHVINIPCIIYHYFTVVSEEWWTRGDLLNGFFGTARGGNTYLNVVFLAVVVISYDYWKKKEMSTKLFTFFFLSCVLMSALIELKIFFIEIFMVFIFSLKINIKKLTLKKVRNAVILVVLFVVIMYIMIQFLYKMYPIFADIFTIEGILSNAFNKKGYSDAGDFNRLTAVFSAFETFFDYDIVKGLFGIGIGTTSDVGGLSEFAQKYEYTHYSWFYSSYIFTQVGFIGLFLYILTYIFMLFMREKNSCFSDISKVYTLLALFLVIYGEALKTDIAYIIYFIIFSGYVKNEGMLKYGNKILSNYTCI